MDDRQVSNIIKLEKKFTALWLAAGLIYFYLRVKKKVTDTPMLRLAFAFAFSCSTCCWELWSFPAFQLPLHLRCFVFLLFVVGAIVSGICFAFFLVSVGAFEYFGMIYCLHADRVLFWLQDFEGYGMMM